MPLELEATPGTQELAGGFSFGSPNEESAASGIGTNIGEVLDYTQVFSKNLAKARKEAENPAESKVEVKEEQGNESAKESGSAVSTEEPAKPVDDKKPSDPNYGKAKVRYSEIPPEQREYLTASEDRKRAKFEEVDTARKTAETRLAELETEVNELRQIKDTLPKERDEWKSKAEKAHGELSEREKELTAYNVRKTKEYQSSVAQPWKKLFEVDLKEITTATGLDGQAVYQAIVSNDRAALGKLVGSLPDELDKGDLRQIINKARELQAKDAEYEAKGGDALKEITERQTTAEKQATEAHQSEMAKARPQVVAAQIKRFNFLDPKAKDTAPELKAEIERLDGMIASFDFAKLSPGDQTRFIEDAHKMTLAANVIDGYAAHVTKEYQDYRAQTETSLREKDTKITDLEKRLGKQQNATLPPGRSGDAPRGVQPAKQATDPLAVFAQGRRAIATGG